MTPSLCPVCSEPKAGPHKMSCRPENRAHASLPGRAMQMLQRCERALSSDPQHNPKGQPMSSLLLDVRAILREAGLL